MTITMVLVVILIVIFLMSMRDPFQSYLTYFSSSESSCKPVDTKKYEYTTRVLNRNKTWVCPFTFFDTGCNWTHKGKGQYQCRRTHGSPVDVERAREYTKNTPFGPTKSSPSTNTQWIDTNITYYGQNTQDDNGKGFTGVDLFALGRSGLQYNGKRVYPVAVHHDDAHDWLYSVVHLTGPKIASNFYGYVVDICNRVDDSCANRNKNNRSFLIDIHKTGFEASGNYNNGKDFTTGRVTKIGSIPLTKLPDSVFLQGKNTYVMCGCSAPCSRQQQRWKKLESLKRGASC